MIYSGFDPDLYRKIAKTSGSAQAVSDIGYVCYAIKMGGYGDRLYAERIDEDAVIAGYRKEHSLRIAVTAVRKDRQGQGLGRILLDRAAEWCRIQGIPKMETRTRTGRKFYEKNGWKAVGEKGGDWYMEYAVPQGKLETGTVRLRDVHPAAYNPRIQLEPGDPEYEALKTSLDRFGLTAPLVVNRATGNLVSGHQRLRVLLGSGAEEAEAVFVNLSPEREKALNIAMNRIEGEWDTQKLEALFEDFSAEDIQATGFTDEELEELAAESERIIRQAAEEYTELEESPEPQVQALREAERPQEAPEMPAEPRSSAGVTNYTAEPEPPSEGLKTQNRGSAPETPVSVHPEPGQRAPAEEPQRPQAKPDTTARLYLSFRTKRGAETWMAEHGINRHFRDGSKDIAVQMRAAG